MDAILNELVIAEAINLKKAATPSELSNLNIEALDSQKLTQCIYGLCTDDCFNRRAVQLIEICCERVYTANVKTPDSPIAGILNGSPIQKDRNEYWSPIEVFIDLKINQINGNNARLIAFLRGETDTLVFE